MSGSDGEAAKPMIENPVRKAADPVPPEAAVCENRVKLTLTMRDRNLIVGACISYCMNPGHKKAQNQDYLDRVKRLLSFDETAEYFAMNNDWVEEERIKWDGARARYRAWLRWKEGTLATEDLMKAYPNIELDDRKLPVKPAKPPFQSPRLKPEEYRGPERIFHVPPKLHIWIVAALKEMDWPTERDDMTEGSAELGRKFGVLDEKIE